LVRFFIYCSTCNVNTLNKFEIKFFKCETKDELDETERNLIEEYDA